MWWLTPVISALGRLKENFEFEAHLGYAVRPCFKKAIRCVSARVEVSGEFPSFLAASSLLGSF